MKVLSALRRFCIRADSFLSKPFLRIRNIQLRAVAMAGALVSIVWIAAALIIPLAPFGDNTLCTNDGYAQYMPFLSEFWSVFRGSGSLLYSFHGALGSNFYLTMAYYLFSPFTFLALLFDKSQIPAAANLIIILKNILVIMIMAWYLASKGKRNMPFLASACAIAYGLGFYFLGYAVNFMWMDSIALLPLMLYGLERISTRKGRCFYLISLAAAVLMNFYMGAILCIFLALYYLVIFFRWNREGWKDFAWFAACSIAAVLAAGIVLVPVIQGMLMANTSRMSPPESEVFNDAQYFFSRLLPDADIIRITGNRGTINLYMGTAVIFGCLLYLFSKQPSRRVKYGLLGLCLLYLISTQISWLNYAFHGFYLQRQVPNRYGFLIGLLAAIMMYQGFLSLRKDKVWKIGLAGLLSACYFAGISAWADLSHLWLAFLLAAVTILYLLTALCKNRKLIAWMIVIESVGGLAMVAPGSLDSSYTQMSKFIEAGKIGASGRSEILCSDIVNAPMLFGMDGVSAFNSVINPDTAGLLGKLGYASGENYYRFFGYTPISTLFLGVRNITAGEDDELPYPFVRSAKVQDLDIWSSPYDIPIGIVMPDSADAVISSTNKFENLNKIYPDSFMLLNVDATLAGDSEAEVKDGKYTLKNIESNDQNVLSLKPFEAQNVYLYANASGTKNFTVHKNGKILADNKYEGNIVWLGDVKPSDVITVTFEAEDDRDEQTVKLQAASLSTAKIEEAARWFSDHGLKDEVIKGNTITGTYTVPYPEGYQHEETTDSSTPMPELSNQTSPPANSEANPNPSDSATNADSESNVKDESAESMVFTIPFDEGWRAKVNSKSVPIKEWQNALVSIPLEYGENQIKLTYIPAGLTTGAWVSVFGILVSILLLLGPQGLSEIKKRIQEKREELVSEKGNARNKNRDQDGNKKTGNNGTKPKEDSELNPLNTSSISSGNSAGTGDTSQHNEEKEEKPNSLKLSRVLKHQLRHHARMLEPRSLDQDQPETREENHSAFETTFLLSINDVNNDLTSTVPEVKETDQGNQDSISLKISEENEEANSDRNLDIPAIASTASLSESDDLDKPESKTEEIQPTADEKVALADKTGSPETQQYQREGFDSEGNQSLGDVETTENDDSNLEAEKVVADLNESSTIVQDEPENSRSKS